MYTHTQLVCTLDWSEEKKKMNFSRTDEDTLNPQANLKFVNCCALF